MSGELKTNNILWLREATLDDMILLFCWVNDPIVRQSAFCVNEISLTTHKRWFAEALMNDYVRIYILQRGDLPVGQVRVELDDEKWMIDYSIDAAWRGYGYGKQILCLLETKMENGACLVGEVKEANVASQKIFEELGYEKYMSNNKNIKEYRKNVVYTGGRHRYCFERINISEFILYWDGFLSGEVA